LVVSGIAFTMTVGVYGLVAAIVKLDDAGLYLARARGDGFLTGAKRWLGLRLVSFAPLLMKGLAFVGTIAMFMVGGGILVHGYHPAQHMVEQFAIQLGDVAVAGSVLQAITPTLFSMLIGLIAGGLIVGLVTLWQKLRPKA
jgi:predicted DNA repair protein MutK